MEVWRDVVDWEDYLQVSNTGRMRSKSRMTEFKDNKPSRIMGGKILKLHLDRRGYPRVKVSCPLKKGMIRIHRAVALAFLPNPDNLPQVNHKDGIKENNLVDNLEWCTNEGNQKHAMANGLKCYPFGKQAKRFTGPVEAYDSTGRLVAVMSGNEEMAKHGFDYRLVSAVIKGKRKSHRGCTFVKKLK